ncbi:MAG: Hint domain-containing protein, partial [Pseudomonadota bacterium]
QADIVEPHVRRQRTAVQHHDAVHSIIDAVIGGRQIGKCDRSATVEVYTANIYGGGTVTFAYLTAANDGVDDAVNRIVVLDGGPLTPNMWLNNISLDDGDNNVEWQTIPSFICFTPGALITTPRGQVPVEDLKVGDLVITADSGLQAIRWVGSKRMTGARLQAYPELRPIRIRKGSFGAGMPERDMWVSPQHRMLVQGNRTLLNYGEADVLAPAKGLLDDYNVTVDYGLKETTYIHIMFDRHEIVWANGTPTESFHPGQHSISTIEEAARDELFEIFPELQDSPERYGPSARLSLKVREAAALTSRREWT